MDIQLKGNRVTLRPFVAGDKESLIENINDPDIYTFTLNIPYPYTNSDAEWWISHTQERIKQGKAYELGIVLKETGQIIGGMGICDLESKHDAAEVGYWLGKKYWGRGITTEALELLLDFAFNELKLHRLYANTLVDNIGSQRVLEKCGFTKEGRRKEAVKKDGKYHDDFIFGLVADDYK